MMLCLENLAVMLAEKELEFDIQAKHLYHDREEITVHIALKIEKAKSGQKTLNFLIALLF